MFDPYFRGTEAQRAKREGCGRGLSSARWIGRAHGGRIDIQSELGAMTTLATRLPCLRSEHFANSSTLAKVLVALM